MSPISSITTSISIRIPLTTYACADGRWACVTENENEKVFGSTETESLNLMYKLLLEKCGVRAETAQKIGVV